MEKIKSFTIDHNILLPGFYLGRVDKNVYTYDLRFKAPNSGDYLKNSAIHTIEHLLATVLRNGEYGNKVVFFGPMGCRTGFNLLLFDTDIDKAKLICVDSIEKSLAFDKIPGSKKKECGNYLSHNLDEAKNELRKYLKVLQFK